MKSDLFKDLSPEEALEEIRNLFGEKRNNTIQRVIDIMDKTGLSRNPATVLHVLWENRNRTVSNDRIINVIEIVCNKQNDDSVSLSGSCKRIRRANLPIEIISTYSLGYKLVPLDKNWSPYYEL